MNNNIITININELNAKELHALANIIGKYNAKASSKIWDRYAEIGGWEEE